MSKDQLEEKAEELAESHYPALHSAPVCRVAFVEGFSAAVVLLEAEIADYRRVLEFYEDECSYGCHQSIFKKPAVMADFGERASAVLAKHGETK